jgi:hypothetical protein
VIFSFFCLFGFWGDFFPCFFLCYVFAQHGGCWLRERCLNLCFAKNKDQVFWRRAERVSHARRVAQFGVVRFSLHERRAAAARSGARHHPTRHLVALREHRERHRDLFLRFPSLCDGSFLRVGVAFFFLTLLFFSRR